MESICISWWAKSTPPFCLELNSYKHNFRRKETKLNVQNFALGHSDNFFMSNMRRECNNTLSKSQPHRILTRALDEGERDARRRRSILGAFAAVQAVMHSAALETQDFTRESWLFNIHQWQKPQQRNLQTWPSYIIHPAFIKFEPKPHQGSITYIANLQIPLPRMALNAM